MDYDRALALIGPFEGRVSHMYLDVNGYVTAGIGALLATPQTAIALIWHRRDGSGEGTEEEISNEWFAVRGCSAGRPADTYRAVTRLDLADHEIDRLFRRRVDEFCAQLASHFPLWPEWPESAQLATLDMAYNLGVGALTSRWPRLCQALRSMDWRMASLDCHRPQSRDARNVAIRELYEASEPGARPTVEIA